MSTRAADFYKGIQQVINDGIAQQNGFPATVTAIAGNKVTIRTTDGTTLSEQYARLWGFDLAVNDYVYCVMVGGKPLIVGKIENGSNVTLSKNLTLNGTLTTTGAATIGGTLNAGATRFAVPTSDKFSISRGGNELVSIVKDGDQERFYFLQNMRLYGRTSSGATTWIVNSETGSASFDGEVTIGTKLMVGDSFYTDHQFTHGYSGSTSMWALDAGNGNARFNGYVSAAGFLNTPWTRTEQQVGSNISSTSSTSTYVVAMTKTYTLPSGTWTITGMGGQQLSNSNNASCAHRITINGYDGGSGINPVYYAANYSTGVNACTVGSVSGSFTATVEYRASGSGTALSKNPWLMLVGIRTS